MARSKRLLFGSLRVPTNPIEHHSMGQEIVSHRTQGDGPNWRSSPIWPSVAQPNRLVAI